MDKLHPIGTRYTRETAVTQDPVTGAYEHRNPVLDPFHSQLQHTLLAHTLPEHRHVAPTLLARYSYHIIVVACAAVALYRCAAVPVSA
jgi:hypothetical protein